MILEKNREYTPLNPLFLEGTSLLPSKKRGQGVCNKTGKYRYEERDNGIRT